MAPIFLLLPHLLIYSFKFCVPRIWLHSYMALPAWHSLIFVKVEQRISLAFKVSKRPFKLLLCLILTHITHFTIYGRIHIDWIILMQMRWKIDSMIKQNRIWHHREKTPRAQELLPRVLIIWIFRVSMQFCCRFIPPKMRLESLNYISWFL